MRNGNSPPPTQYHASRVRQVVARLDPYLVAIVGLGAFLRFTAIGAQSLWYDEVVTREEVLAPAAGLIGRIRSNEGTPPLYFVLAAVWTRLVGGSDAALRSFSALAGTVAIPVVYATVRELGLNKRTARVAAVITAVNPFLIWYSQEARAYSLVALFASGSIYTYARARRRETTTSYFAFGIVATAALLTHYFAIFLILPEVLLLARSAPRRRSVLIGLLPLGAALLPLGLLAIDQRSRNLQDWITAWSPGFRVAAAIRHLAIGPSSPRPWLWIVPICAAAIGLTLALLSGQGRYRRVAVEMIVIAASVFVVPMVGVAVGADYFLDRNIIVVLVPTIIVVAVGLADPRRRGVGMAVTALAVAASLVTVNAVTRDADLQRADWRAVASKMPAPSDGGILVMNAGGVLDLAVRRYLPTAQTVADNAPIRTRELVFVGLDAAGPRQCDWWFGRACSIVYLTAAPTTPLPASFRLVRKSRVGDFSIAVFRSDTAVSLRRTGLVRRADLPGSVVFRLGHPRRVRRSARQPNGRGSAPTAHVLKY